MNHSIYSVDRTTHTKIVVTALAASIGVAVCGIALRTTNTDNEYAQAAHVIITKSHGLSTR